jgi:hypothetical protein
VADAFCASRLEHDWEPTFGTLPAAADCAAIIEFGRLTRELHGCQPQPGSASARPRRLTGGESSAPSSCAVAIGDLAISM